VNVFFDVLDTLLTEEDVPRPHAREVFQELREMGHEVYLWSSAGAAYAAVAAEVLGVADLVEGCFGKRHEPEVAVDFAVDDNASVVESHGGYRVEPFGGDPLDEELLRVAEAVEASGGDLGTP
jgi:phosphoglycolate phosphatase-like HAD superfamily hydrolase